MNEKQTLENLTLPILAVAALLTWSSCTNIRNILGGGDVIKSEALKHLREIEQDALGKMGSEYHGTMSIDSILGMADSLALQTLTADLSGDLGRRNEKHNKKIQKAAGKKKGKIKFKPTTLKFKGKPTQFDPSDPNIGTIIKEQGDISAAYQRELGALPTASDKNRSDTGKQAADKKAIDAAAAKIAKEFKEYLRALLAYVRATYTKGITIEKKSK